MDTSALKQKAEEVMSFFNNPLATPIGTLVEKSTSHENVTENWELFLHICDVLNTDPGQSQNFIKAVKKRLNTSKNYTTTMYTLILLEAVVKNCGVKVIDLIMSKDFLNELVRVMSPKNEPPQQISDKILSLIQSWADCFKNKSDLIELYEELKEKGLQFPPTDLDHMAPILMAKKPSKSPQSPQEESVFHPVVFNTGPLKASQVQKLRLDLQIIENNVTVFNEVLNDKNINDEDLRFLEALNKACKEMQRRLANLLSSHQLQLESEMVTQCLQINDDLNNAFLRYERFCKNSEKNQNVNCGGGSSSSSRLEPQGCLIDFETSKESTGAIPKVSSKKDDDFDAFVKERRSKSKPGQENLVAPDEEEILKTHSESDFQEMEQWLSTFPSGGQQETLSSTEFDKFLQERANK